MAADNQITSFQNPRLKQIKKLREHRAREKENLFIIDDSRDLSRALDCGYAVAYALFCPALSHADDGGLLDRIPAHRVYKISPDMLAKVAYRQNPSALLAVMEQKPRLVLDDLRRGCETVDALILALVDLRKPGNIGALLRTADAAGFKIICLIDTALDIYNPNIIRSSIGACFLNNIYHLSTGETLPFFRQQGFAVVAATVAGDRTLFEVDFRRKVALVLGTEDQGLENTWLEEADVWVKIPMVGVLSDSLNVSVSGAVLMYEALRQRS